MKCKQCEYLLWDIRERRCPECGTEFRPSHYEFNLNAVQFCCPDCGQAYYGTGAKGHLEPAEFDCVRCGRHLTMDDMVLRPTVGVSESATEMEVNPWVERKKRGFFRGYFGTFSRALGSPAKLMDITPVESSGWSAWWFAVFTATPCVLIGGGWFMCGPMLARGAGVGAIVMLLGAIVAPAVVISLWAVAAHALLKLGGSAACGLGRTMQAIGYGVPGVFPAAVPCLGLLLGLPGLVWWTVLSAVMLSRAQRVGGGRAAFAVVTPVVVVVLAAASLMYVGIASSVAAAKAVSAMVGGPTSAQTQRITSALSAHVDASGSPAWPGHVCELIDASTLTAQDVVDPGLGPHTPRLGSGATLAQHVVMTNDQRARVVAAEIAALPVETVAYRVGDFVFTHPGVPRSGGAATGLWIVVESPDPARTPPAVYPPGRARNVGLAMGAVMPIAGGAWASALQQQNTLRASVGLAPLPDPDTITVRQPAVGK